MICVDLKRGLIKNFIFSYCTGKNLSIVAKLKPYIIDSMFPWLWGRYSGEVQQLDGLEKKVYQGGKKARKRYNGMRSWLGFKCTIHYTPLKLIWFRARLITCNNL